MEIQLLSRRVRVLGAVSSLLVLGMAGGAAAQAVEVAQHAEAATLETPEANETAASVSAGANLATGNTQSWQANVGADLRVVRDVHALGAMLNFIYGQAKLPESEDTSFQDTVRNLNARLRYDYFLSEMDALFLSAVYRWDTFAGLDTRVQGQVGYLRNLVAQEGLRFWLEVGYDLTYDNYTQDVMDIIEAAGDEIEENVIVHSARLFLGYDNQINENLVWVTGLEGLVNVEEPVDFRLNWDNALRSAIGGDFQLELKFSLKYDNQPVPGTKTLDTLTQANLIYTLM